MELKKQQMPELKSVVINHLLIVEDNPDDVDLIKLHLQRAGVSCPSIDIAVSGVDAINLLNINEYDLVMLDYSLPDMTAQDIMERLNAEGLGGTFPALVLTVHDDRRVAVDLMKLGIYDYIYKNELTSELLTKSVTYVLNQFEKYSIRKKYMSELSRRAMYDDLTQLPNRSLFFDRLTQTINQAERHDEKFALLFADLNKFKEINDELGHLVGDQVLVAVGKRLSGIFRSADTVARYGGDEFVAILTEIGDIEDARLAEKKIQEAITQPIQIKGVEIRLSVSVGIALFPAHGSEINEILEYADRAMYKTKQTQRLAHNSTKSHFK